ncbi:MAG: hypothetical protein JJ896_02375 [Rhodothermales bacterium]|nr:hypothetical protein [Rhodothermales bacterium]MBO6778476.1 hypothetical protein [Rhodothermales bacterium]
MKAALTALTVLSVFVAGCSSAARVAVPRDAGVETVAFTTDAEQIDVVDVATAVLVAHDFTITLANERLGLLQTDYTSVAGIEAMRADSGLAHPALNELYMRLTVNADDRGDVRFVQIKGNFQRMQDGQAPDGLMGLYWMERLADDMARELGSDYLQRVSAETYNQALANADLPGQSAGRQDQLGSGLRAVGIVGAILFAATLAAGVLSPSSSR